MCPAKKSLNQPETAKWFECEPEINLSSANTEIFPNNILFWLYKNSANFRSQLKQGVSSISSIIKYKVRMQIFIIIIECLLAERLKMSVIFMKLLTIRKSDDNKLSLSLQEFQLQFRVFRVKWGGPLLGKS